jgi:AI-2 transport protein TqsA
MGMLSDPGPRRAPSSRVVVALLSVIAVILVVSALRATYFVTMPLAFAFFTTILVWPVHQWLHRRLPARFGWVATALVLLGIMWVMGAFLATAAIIVYTITGDRAHQLLDEWSGRWEALVAWLREQGFPVPGEAGGVPLAGDIAEWAGGAALSLTGVATVVVLVVFFTLLMLVEAHHWAQKSRATIPGADVGKIMGGISTQVRTFILVQAFVAFVTAAVTGFWLWAVGMPFVLLWALLTFLVDFVPNVGPTVAGVFISLMALVFLGWQRALVTGVGILAIQQFFGNYVDPMLKGHRMSISPLVVLLSVVFWAWVWGPAGAVLAVPLTATLIIACAHIPSLEPIAVMLSRTVEEVRSGAPAEGD